MPRPRLSVSQSAGHRCHRTGATPPHNFSREAARNQKRWSAVRFIRTDRAEPWFRGEPGIASYRARRGPPGTRKWAAAPGRLTGKKFFAAWQRKKAFALGFLTSELAGPPHRFVLLPGRPFRRFLVEPSALHLAKHAFALHLLFEHPKRLIDVVVANHYLQEISPSWSVEVVVGA